MIKLLTFTCYRVKDFSPQKNSNTPNSFSIEYKAFRWAGIALRTPGRLKNSSFSDQHLLHCYKIVDYLYRIVNDGKIKFQLLHSSDNIMVYHLF